MNENQKTTIAELREKMLAAEDALDAAERRYDEASRAYELYLEAKNDEEAARDGGPGSNSAYSSACGVWN